MREQLLGYLLGALDPAEQALVEERLTQDAELRRELDDLRVRLEPLAEDEPETSEASPPRGLAARTFRYVMSRRGPTADQFASSSDWRLQDILVAAGIALAASLLFVPAVLHSRQNAQMRVCQSNLSSLGHALMDYSNLHSGYFPEVPADGKEAAAGIYAPKLVQSQLIDGHELICPTSSLCANRQPWRVPSLEEIQRAHGEQLRRLRCMMGGDYGYSLGYVDSAGRYHPVRNLSRPTFAVMADNEGTHGGGQNVLFEDGHVSYLKECRLPEAGDHIYQNGLGVVGAGIGPDDAVIGRSETQPVIFHVRIKY